jgi:hypothetical protein
VNVVSAGPLLRRYIIRRDGLCYVFEHAQESSQLKLTNARMSKIVNMPVEVKVLLQQYGVELDTPTVKTTEQPAAQTAATAPYSGVFFALAASGADDELAEEPYDDAESDLAARAPSHDKM